MTYEQEYKKYIKILTPLNDIELYIENKDAGMLRAILSEYKANYKKVRTDKAIADLISGICPMKKALRKLDARTEVQEEADLLIREDLERAMYG
ncbi:hypothetical protein ACFX5D_14645 [Flavobacterium sp. LB3P45]|uniref:Uncharacterized protein n=1 Tax=Flavobacterium fructosi TaxID=3230416 RepID=A0ABW6HQT3_9FLAO